MEIEDVYWFRCDTPCTFNGTFYEDSLAEGGDFHVFPGTMLFDVPQHFTAVKAGNVPGLEKAVYIGPDSKSQALRDAFFAASLALNRVDGGESEAVRKQKTAELKANFFAFGQATPTGAMTTSAPIVTVESALADSEEEEGGT